MIVGDNVFLMFRSRSRSRVSDSMYDSYRTERAGAGAADSYLSSYSGSRPSSSYLYGHSYSNYHEGITPQEAPDDKDSFPARHLNYRIYLKHNNCNNCMVDDL